MAEIGLNFQLPVNTIPSITLISYIQGHITNTEKLMISQSVHGGKFSAIFATSKLYSPRPAHNWGIRRSYYSFVEFVEEEWEWKESQRGYIPPLRWEFRIRSMLDGKVWQKSNYFKRHCKYSEKLGWRHWDYCVCCMRMYILHYHDKGHFAQARRTKRFALLYSPRVSVVSAVIFASFKKMTWMRKYNGFVKVSAEVTGEAKS